MNFVIKTWLTTFADFEGCGTGQSRINKTATKWLVNVWTLSVYGQRNWSSKNFAYEEWCHIVNEAFFAPNGGQSKILSLSIEAIRREIRWQMEKIFEFQTVTIMDKKRFV